MHHKIVTPAEALAWRTEHLHGRRRVVFTNGVFDLLHAGHVEVLAAARALGEALIVGLNTDAGVRRLKGPERPLCCQEDRALVLAALEMVDRVVLFDEDTPRELILDLRPDVLVKGADYAPDQIVGAREVTAAGGRVETIALRPGRSSSDLVRRIREGRGIELPPAR
jgi:rfaE bifunctional protein nucleotidyltransferase chain/domain